MAGPRQNKVSRSSGQNNHDQNNDPVERVFENTEVDDAVHSAPLTRRVLATLINLLGQPNQREPDADHNDDGQPVRKVERDDVFIHGSKPHSTIET